MCSAVSIAEETYSAREDADSHVWNDQIVTEEPYQEADVRGLPKNFLPGGTQLAVRGVVEEIAR
jgi:hypothetical protein